MLYRHLLSTLTIILLGAGLAHADLDGYLDSLRISAAGNIGDYRVGLGAHFGASGAELDHVFLSVNDPGDAALCFWLSRNSGYPVDYVVKHYHKNKGKGWGALAQSLGIKPGSAQFKALKAGQIGWDPPHKYRGGHDDHDDHGGKNKGNDKGKDKDKGKKK